MEPLDNDSKKARHKSITDEFLPYLKRSLGVDFEWKGNSLHQLRQYDSSSCGPCTINFLEPLVHKQSEMWSFQEAASYWISLFLQMTQYSLEMMVSL